MDVADGASYECKLINFTFCHLSNIKGSMDHVADCTTSTFKNQIETKEKMRADLELMKSRGQPLDRDAPLMMKLIDPDDDGVWGNIEQPFVGFKIASKAYRENDKASPEDIEMSKEPEVKPKWMQDEKPQEDVNMKEPTPEKLGEGVD